MLTTSIDFAAIDMTNICQLRKLVIKMFLVSVKSEIKFSRQAKDDAFVTQFLITSLIFASARTVQ